MKKTITTGILLACAIFTAQAQQTANEVPASTTYTHQVPQTRSQGGPLTYVVPAGVTQIRIIAEGASGGEGPAPISGIPGKGALAAGTFTVVPGEELNYIEGEKGQAGQFIGGGGGGSFVWRNSDQSLLLAAGGGGGAGASDGGPAFIDGIDASITENGTNGAGMTDGGGVNGNGGTVPTAINYASGGAGWLSDGANGTIHGCQQNSTGGIRPLANGFGGTGGGSASEPSNGGFGGGGGGNARCGAVGGGGGGGYSGGGAGGEVVLGEYNGGGGGGSFNAGLDPVMTAGTNTNDGVVIFNAFPTINCTSIVIDNDQGICGAVVGFNITATDTEDGTITPLQTSGLPSGSIFPVGITQVIFEATDGDGNTSTCTFDVEVIDMEAPVIVCPSNQTVTVDEGDLFMVPDYIALNQATVMENCSVATFTQSPAPGTMLSPGVQTITFFAEDNSGLDSMCDFELTVDEILGVSNNTLANISVYPNPAKDVLHIANATNIEISEIIIYDITGRIVVRKNSANTLTLSHLIAGNYILKIITNQGTKMEQLVKR